MECQAHFTALFGQHPVCSCLDHLIIFVWVYGCSIDKTFRRKADAKRHCRIMNGETYNHVCVLASSHRTLGRPQ